jgi:hypothetical protein
MLAALEVMNRDRPDLMGLMSESFGALTPPLPVPPLARAAWEVQGNRDWRGMPIVPRRDEAMGAWDKFTQYQGPYAFRQLTGGRGEAITAPLTGQGSVLRGLGVAPREVTAHRSVDEVFARYAKLDEQRSKARRAGVPFAGEAEYQRLNDFTSALRQISQALRGESRQGNRIVRGQVPTGERLAILRQRQLELARRALQR